MPRNRGLQLRFLVLYAGVSLMALLWYCFEMIWIKRKTVAYILEFPLPTLLVLLGLMIGLLQLYTYWQIGAVQARLVRGDPLPDAEADALHRRAIRFPFRVMLAITVYGGVLIPVYHILHFVYDGHSLLAVERQYWLNFVRSFLFEQTIVLAVAVATFAWSRRLVRPLLISLRAATGAGLRRRSFMSMLALTYAGLLAIGIFSIAWYVVVGEIKGEPLNYTLLIGLAVVETAFAFGIFLLLSNEYRRELLVLTESMRELADGEAARRLERMPILSDDETGMLALTFNRLRERAQDEYDELDKEKQRARELLRLLMDGSLRQFGEYRIEAAVSDADSDELAACFWEAANTADGKFVVALGAVHGVTGLPAALLVSAAVVLLRAEADRGGSAADMLERLNRLVQSTLLPDSRFELALLLADPATAAVELADGGACVLAAGERCTLALAAPGGGDERLTVSVIRETAKEGGDRSDATGNPEDSKPHFS